MRAVKILGTGKYLPRRKVSAAELAEQLNISANWIIKKSGVHTRHFASEDETVVTMAAAAAEAAAAEAGIQLTDVDAIINASGTPYMPIPCTAAVLHHQLGFNHRNIPAWDIDSTCLSFLTALDSLSYMVASGRFRRVLIVSAERASTALNWKDLDSATLFGDGAAAVIVGATEGNDSSAILAAGMETYSDGWEYCHITGGGSRLHPREHQPGDDKRFLFSMDGPRLFKMVSKKLPGFIDQLLSEANTTLSDVQVVIPHQASQMAMRILKNKLAIRDDQWVSIIEEHGNVIAASIPMALHESIQQGRLERGQMALLCGTSAGVSLGGVILRY